MTLWMTIYGQDKPNQRALNQFCLIWLMVLGGNLLYLPSWLEIPTAIHPFLLLLGIQISGGLAYFVGRQLFILSRHPHSEDYGHEN
ncbi:MAG: hypothetical protein OHK0012_14640 [Synechococcales cyanobacterium]